MGKSIYDIFLLQIERQRSLLKEKMFTLGVKIKMIDTHKLISILFPF